MAFLGLSFIACALLVTGLPPLSGFVAKFLILSAALDTAPLETVPASIWVLWAAVLGSSLVGVIALCKMGVRLFWSSDEIVTPQLHLIEAAPVAVLLLLTVALAAGAGPATEYLGLAGNSLSSPQIYIDAVLGNVFCRLLSIRIHRGNRGWGWTSLRESRDETMAIPDAIYGTPVCLMAPAQ